MFVDSDDWLENDMLETMYKKAVSDDLDIVYCGIYRNTDTRQYEYCSPFLDDKIEMIKQIVKWQNFSPAVWNKLVKREIYQKINFPRINYGEDRQIIIQAVHYANKIAYTREKLYHYYKNENSLCNSGDRSKILQRHLDDAEITAWMIDFFYNNYNSYFSVLEPELSDYVNSLKMRFVQEKAIRNSSIFHKLYPPSNRFIFRSSWHERFANRVILFLAVHDRTFILVDAFDTVYRIIRAVYRIIIPKNIRSVIRQKRNNRFKDS